MPETQAGVHSVARNILLVARREYLERVRAKSFMVMTVLIPLLMGGLLYGAAFVAARGGSLQHIAVVTQDAQFGRDFAAELNTAGTSAAAGAQKNVTVEVRAPEPGVRAALDAQLQEKNGTLDGYLLENAPSAADSQPEFIWVPRSKADIMGRGRVAEAVRAALLRENLSRSMSAAAVDTLMKPVDLESASKGEDTGAAFGSAYGMFFLMYFVILFYGMNVARSIIEEKTSRVFEVLLATLRPGEMLAGKVIGVGSVGLTQVGIWIAVAVFAMKAWGAGANLHVLPSAGQTVFFVVFFLLGFVLYSSIAAALGAMTNSEQELQQMNIFLMLPLIACSVVIVNVVTNPDGAVAKAFSFIPFCTPLIMYTRLIVGKPGAMAIGISLAEMVATIVVVLWIASRIYRVGVLMYGKKPNLPEILRWLRYS